MIVCPTDPLALPPPERCDAALALLRKIRPDAREPELLITETPQFIHNGSNFEGVFCPFCTAEITDWWTDEMDRWWKGDHRLLTIETSCCHRTTSLNDLDYVMPQGFACVAIELMNPRGDLEPSEREQVEAALGVPVRVIWRHI